MAIVLLFSFLFFLILDGMSEKGKQKLTTQRLTGPPTVCVKATC